MGTASDDSMEGSVFTSSVDVGGFFLPLVVLEEARICDGIYVNVARRASGGFEEGVVSFVVDFVRGEEEFGFIDRFVDGESPGGPIDDWVGSPQPGESQDYVVFERHNVEGYFLGNPFDVGEEGTGVLDISFLVEGSIGVSGADGIF